MTDRACPSDTDLRAFSLGDLADDRLNAVAEHLERCPACEAAVAALDRASDAAITSLRALAAASQAPGDATLPPPPCVGQRVGTYEILGELGRGGMGVVYKARDRNLRRVVALKMLLAGPFASASFRGRFQAEAEAIARLRHPNIIQVYDVGEWQPDGPGAPVPFLALEYVDGGSLDALAGGRPQAPAQAARWSETLARAVHYAHGQGVVHRDLKPSNILFTAAGEIKLCDFSVAKLETGSDLRTATGMLVGTPEYMAPEQASGHSKDAGPAADVYALGAILYDLLTGRPPFQAPDAFGVLEQVRTRDPVAPSRLQASVPRDLNTICLKCLEKDPKKRYASAGALADDLNRYLTGQPIQARRARLVERSWKWARRRPALAGLLAISFLLLTAGLPSVTALWLRADAARTQADEARDRAEAALYHSHIALAEQAWHRDDITAAERLLDGLIPEPGRRDRRGWEWFYLQRLGRADLFPAMTHAEGETEYVRDVVWGPDGRSLASAGGAPNGILSRPNLHLEVPGHVRFWDAETGKAVATFAEHKAAVWAADRSPDGTLFASSGPDGTCLIWDRKSSVRARLPLPAGEWLGRVRFSPDGRLLAVATHQRLWLWDVAAGRLRGPFPLLGYDGHRAALAFRPDGKTLVGGGPRLVAYDLTTPDPTVIERPRGIDATFIKAAAFADDGRTLALATTDAVEIWDYETGRLRQQLRGHRGSAAALAFGRGSLLATGGDDGTVRLWDAATGAERRVLRGHRALVSGVAFRPDGRRLASCGWDGVVKVWDAERDECAILSSLLLAEWLGTLAFDAEGRVLVASRAPNTKAIYRLDPATGAETYSADLPRTISPYNPNRDLAFDPAGRRFAAPDPKDPTTVKLWDLETREEAAELRGPTEPVRAVAWSGDGRFVATSANAPPKADAPFPDGDVRLWNAADGTELRRWSLPKTFAMSLALAADGAHLAASLLGERNRGGVDSTPGEMVVWNAATGTERRRWDGAPGLSCALAFSPDGKQLAAAAYHAGQVRLWDAATGASLMAADAGTAVTSVAFSPDGRRLAASGFDNRVRLYDATTGLETLTLTSLGRSGSGNYNFTARVAFSPDGRRLAANNWMGEVTIWDSGER